MIRHAQYKLLTGMISATCLFILPGIAHAQVSTPAVTFANGLYHYDYSITNATADDLFTVTIQVLPYNDPNIQPDPNSPNNPVINVTAPAGFMASYDPVNGFVGYTEFTGIFTSTPLNGFTYDSTFAPMSSVFEADFAVNGITPTFGTTLAAVPEPDSVALLGAMSAAACFAMRRRVRNTKAAQAKSRIRRTELNRAPVFVLFSFCPLWADKGDRYEAFVQARRPDAGRRNARSSRYAVAGFQPQRRAPHQTRPAG